MIHLVFGFRCAISPFDRRSRWLFERNSGSKIEWPSRHGGLSTDADCVSHVANKATGKAGRSVDTFSLAFSRRLSPPTGRGEDRVVRPVPPWLNQFSRYIDPRDHARQMDISWAWECGIISLAGCIMHEVDIEYLVTDPRLISKRDRNGEMEVCVRCSRS